ncbi:MAG TPA: dockerin type I domain-containing protein, partial [Verrucomicrobiota bacterium]|nr:dockerin type I domain-containing protein [Verrucomicrobiota bacterium]
MSTDDPNTRRDGEGLEALPRLAAALKEVSARRVFVPPSVDAAVLRAAREHLQPARPRRFRWRFLFPALATACVMIVAGYAWFAQRERAHEFAREDINRDGKVDVLDAFQLARELNAGSAPENRDLNGDGTVDHLDVE